MKQRFFAAVAIACVLTAVSASADTARAMYTRALAQERTVRDASTNPTVAQMRRVVASYEAIVRLHPSSGYADNALWQAANLSLLAYQRFDSDADRKTATRLLNLLVKEYPSSSLVAQAKDALASPTVLAESLSAPLPAVIPAKDSAPIAKDSVPVTAGAPMLREIHRTALPDGVRLTVDLDAEVPYHQEEIANPRRLFFDLKGVKPVPNLQDVALKYDGDVVKEVRLGRHPQNTTRLVVDLDGISGYTVYPLYSPYRLVIDLRRGSGATPTSTPALNLVAVSAPLVTPPVVTLDAKAWNAGVTVHDVRPPAAIPAPAPAPPAAPPALTAGPASLSSLPPVAPSANLNGKFSLSRQLGLSVSRIVIDAGHGGHDPGAQGNGIDEKDLTLDVAQRLKKLLEKQPGVEIVMTRDSDEFIPLQERTAIANREGADLFLSIHANASRNAQAHGIETYFLNFAMNPEAEAVAARENAGSNQAMHALPDIVKAIALNNKLNESRDFAATVQKSMVKKLGAKNKSLRDLGVKQAPFVVLIGASMPSVLAEISFVTNKSDGAFLKKQDYRQQIAQALLDAVVKYQQSLKQMKAATAKKATDQ
jgi:N-acetylmuramoyl-L-alanine amidase